MPDLQGQVGELMFTIQVKRKETGQVEEYQLVGKITDEQFKELEDGRNTQHSSPKCSD